jgi:hypothetical protein
MRQLHLKAAFKSDLNFILDHLKTKSRLAIAHYFPAINGISDKAKSNMAAIPCHFAASTL